MNVPQEEDKRYQGKSETETVLPSNNALKSAPPCSKVQNCGPPKIKGNRRRGDGKGARI